MESYWHETKVDNEPMRIYVSLPEGTGPHPGVVVIQAQAGVDQFIQETTQKIAAFGYFAAAPDLYHRDPPDCQDDSPTRRGRLRDVTIIKDVNTAVDFLKGNTSVDSERLGIIGFCMGGRVVYLMAAVNPAFKAAVYYYGGNTFLPWGDSPTPFERTADIHCPLQGHFGEEDQNPSPEDMRKLDAELTKYGKVREFHTYSKTGHGFLNKYNKNHYRPHAEAASWPRTFDFLAKYLNEPAPKAAAL